VWLDPMTRAVILSAVRTPIGRYGGGPAAVRPDDLAALAPELRRRDGRYGLATLCVGAGKGQAALFERSPG
jgi:acetyl-CoA acetyltransferase